MTAIPIHNFYHTGICVADPDWTIGFFTMFYDLNL